MVMGVLLHPAWAQSPGLELTTPGISSAKPAPPTPPPRKAPTQFFRELLAASPAERERQLSSRPAEARQLIESKLREFEILPPAQRELRLKVAELQYHLSPLLRADSDSRTHLLAEAPADLIPLLKERLHAWDDLPTSQRRDLLEGEESLAWFVRLQAAPAGNLTNLLAKVPASQRTALETGYARWIALTPEQRARKTADFQRFFELSDRERDKVLSALPSTERVLMESTLAQFSKLPPEQRARVVQGFRRYQALNASDRMEFLQNVARWQSMTPAERAAWRDLVQHATQAPPMPPNPARRPSQLVSTNANERATGL